VAERRHPPEQDLEVAATLPIMNNKSFYWQARATWDRTRTYITELLVPDFLYDGGTAQGTSSMFYFTADKRKSCQPGEVGHLPGEPGFGPAKPGPAAPARSSTATATSTPGCS
jgi:hypothetical protein